MTLLDVTIITIHSTLMTRELCLRVDPAGIREASFRQ